jgi:hypothetical protein
MAAKSCDHHDSCPKSTKLRKVDLHRLQIAPDLALQLRAMSVMFVKMCLPPQGCNSGE